MRVLKRRSFLNHNKPFLQISILNIKIEILGAELYQKKISNNIKTKKDHIKFLKTFIKTKELFFKLNQIFQSGQCGDQLGRGAGVPGFGRGRGRRVDQDTGQPEQRGFRAHLLPRNRLLRTVLTFSTQGIFLFDAMQLI